MLSTTTCSTDSSSYQSTCTEVPGKDWPKQHVLGLAQHGFSALPTEQSSHTWIQLLWALRLSPASQYCHSFVGKISYPFEFHFYLCCLLPGLFPALLAPSIAGEPIGSQTPGLVVFWLLLDGCRLVALIIVQAIYLIFSYFFTVGELTVTSFDISFNFQIISTVPSAHSTLICWRTSRCPDSRSGCLAASFERRSACGTKISIRKLNYPQQFILGCYVLFQLGLLIFVVTNLFDSSHIQSI